jgi:hypothetical protein
MPPPNPKNQGLFSAAANDLGLGDLFAEELLDEEGRRKRLKEGQKANPANYGDMVLGGAAAMQLFPEYGKSK